MSTTSSPHHTNKARLEAKRDFLIEAARQYAHGTATIDDLEVAAVEFAEVFAAVAMANIRERTRTRE